MKKSEWTFGYKVVARVGRHYESATSLGRVVRYSTKTITKRPKCCGPLTVFKFQSDARRFVDLFLDNTRKLVIRRCHYLEAKELKGRWRIWKPGHGSSVLPIGTILADEVQLVQENK